MDIDIDEIMDDYEEVIVELMSQIVATITDNIIEDLEDQDYDVTPAMELKISEAAYNKVHE